MDANVLTCRPELDSRMGIPVGGMRLPALDDDYGIPGLRREFIGLGIQPLLMHGTKSKDDTMGDEGIRYRN